MKTKKVEFKEYDFKLPNWSLCYLINGDPSGLTDEEVKLCDQFSDQFESYFNIEIKDHDQKYFSSSPAFGLPCDVFDVTIYVEKKDQSSPLLPYIGTVPVTDEIRFLRKIENNKTSWYLPGVH